MGVTHSMDAEQVKRISKALNQSATAIQGINNKFEAIDVHVQRMLDFNATTNAKMHAAVGSFERLDDTFNDRAEMFLEAVVGATNSATDCLEAAVLALEKVDIRKEIDNVPKALIPLAIPFIILLIELAVSNAYLGILLASLPSVSLRYSNYLLAYASSTLMGLFLSLTWLVCYRVWLSLHRTSTSTEAQTVARLKRLRFQSARGGAHASFNSENSRKSDVVQEDRAHELDRQVSPGESHVSHVSERSTILGFNANARAADSIARVRARRELRRLKRMNSQGLQLDDSLAATPDSANLSPLASAAPDPFREFLTKQPLPEDATALPSPGESVPLSGDRRPVRFGRSRSRSDEAFQDHRSAGRTSRRRTKSPPSSPRRTKSPEPMWTPSTQWRTKSPEPPDQDPNQPVMDEGLESGRSSSMPQDGIRGAEQASVKPARRSVMQTRWNKWENPFSLEVTWGRPAPASSATERSDSASPEPVQAEGQRSRHSEREDLGELWGV
mmetsp:Transcript_66408/g.156380  ORF Transcript_66408/g.156380 Transcript_66408/m.156380 type:complete len:500 (-) Transcript_66408:75-1574(-)